MMTSLRAQKALKPKKPKHPLFIGVYVDKATLASLDRIARDEAASRSFIVQIGRAHV